MADIFMSAKSVLRRANHHIADLKSEIETFTADKPYSYVIERDSQTGKDAHIVRFSESFSDDLSCILFDAVNNLRSCLDQMTWAIQVKHSGIKKTVYFPFASDATHWANKIKGLKDLPGEIRTFFEGFKAYKGGDNTLFALNYIANTNKHALLIPHNFGKATMRLPGAPWYGMRTLGFSADKNEVVLFLTDSNQQAQAEFTYSIVIRDTEEVIKGKHPVTLLNAMSGVVERILLGTEAECRRIGLIKS
jgi:hypothetical protein